MKAIVCDSCGKVILIPDRTNIYVNNGVHRLFSDTLDVAELDLCDECANKLVEAVRNNKVNT